MEASIGTNSLGIVSSICRFNDFILYHGECSICEEIWTNHGLNESGLVEYDKIDEDINKMTPGDVLMECLLRVEWVVFCTSNINDTDINSLVYLNKFLRRKFYFWLWKWLV